jgi:hypothetical protein
VNEFTCPCCGDPAPTSAVTDWEGRLDGYCLDCAHARCDWRIGGCGKPRRIDAAFRRIRERYRTAFDRLADL